ncbi:MAG: hypothetical protein V1736_09420 [Pseudomonadota bacterium]
MGSSLWLFLLAILQLFKGKSAEDALGIGLFVISISLIFHLAPWRHPETKYWKLMLPILSVLVVSAALFVRLEGGLMATGLDWWDLGWLLPRGACRT